MTPSFLRSYADPSAGLQTTMDVAVVIPTILRNSLVEALHSVFAQDFAGRIQVLIGVDQPVGDLDLIDIACRARPSNCVVQVVYPGYSTSVRHGGLCPARDGGVLRCILTYLANSPFIAYLDDDNWWDPQHLRRLRDAIEGQDWAYSQRWFVHPLSRRPVCVDAWESVGPGKGVFAEDFGGFVDPNCLMINKLACAEAIPCWNYPLPRDAKAMSADRRVFSVLRNHRRVGATGEPTTYYLLDPADQMHPARLKHMGARYEEIGREPPPPPILPPPRSAAAPPTRSPMAAKLMELLHGVDIYEGFTDLLPEDLQGWNSVNPLFPAIIQSAEPVVLIDVGVWKGGSTVYLADLLRQRGVDGAVIAVDTFLGSPEHWDRNGPFSRGLLRQHGQPLLYRQFLSNVLHRGLAGRVVPLAQSSENAALILRHAGVSASLIHVDAAHEYEAVRRDLAAYWELLSPGGYLVGDDYVQEWPDVIRAADDFAAALGLPLQLSPPKFFWRKPPA